MAPRQLAALKRLRERIETWRASRAKLHPMPAPLWREAAELAHELGVNPVRSALGLNYESLKKHVEDGAVPSGSVNGAPSVGFVELSGAQVLGLSSAAGPMVEICDGSGVRLTVRLPAGSTVDVAELVKAFRERVA